MLYNKNINAKKGVDNVVRGFYTLASGMLTQNRILNTVSNNISNADTVGFKKSDMTTKAFGDLLIERVKNGEATPVGHTTLMNTVDRTYTDYTEGEINKTGRILDFAINGDGFFGIQTNNGTIYTRNGSFDIDANGYLVLKGKGRVLGQNGPIKPNTDNITSDGSGNIFAGGKKVGQIAVYGFSDLNTLKTTGEGVYTGNSSGLIKNPKLLWKCTENSNVNMANEMTNAIAAQRQLQNCSEALKMYDQVLDEATTQIGKV